MTGSLLAFVLVSLFVIVTPGPDTALTVRNTLMWGRFAGIGTALGVSTGQMIWALATSAGLVALLRGGVVYLLKLGVLACALVVFEVSIAKMRVFRVGEFLGGALMLGFLGTFLLFVSRAM